MSSIQELANALRGVAEQLERTLAYTRAAETPLHEAKASLLALKRTEDGWYPAEFDLALSELTHANELIARGREALLTYLMRL